MSTDPTLKPDRTADWYMDVVWPLLPVQAFELMQRAVAHDKRDLATAQQAQAEAKAIADELGSAE